VDVDEERRKSAAVFERKIFKRMCGHKYENAEWKSRTDRKLEEMSEGENVVEWIKGQRISWLGHLERMEKDRMSKKIFTQELEGTRRRGKLRKRWKEEVESKLKHESCFSLQPGHYSSITAPNLQHTTNQERNDQCGNQHQSRELLMMGIMVPETC